MRAVSALDLSRRALFPASGARNAPSSPSVSLLALSGLLVGSGCAFFGRQPVVCEKKSKDAGENICWGAHPEGFRFEGYFVLKQLQSKGRGSREVKMLAALSSSPTWRLYVPKYYGTIEDESGNTWMQIGNLVAGMKDPVVMDLKVGVRSWGVSGDAARTKSKQMKALNTTSGTLGLVVTGCTIPGPKYEAGTGESVGRRAGDHITAEKMPDVLRRFLVTEARVRQARFFTSSLLALFRTQSDYAFFSSSLLIAYDAALGDDAPLKVTMIDFCHTHTMAEMQAEAEEAGFGDSFCARDLSYIRGLASLVDMLDTILATSDLR